MKISLKSLIKILVHNNHRFVIEALPNHGHIFKFVVSKEYPTMKAHMTFGSKLETDLVNRDRLNSNDVFVLAHLDTKCDFLLSASMEVYQAIKELQVKKISKRIAQS